MTSAATASPVLQRALTEMVEKLHSEGWEVVTEPGPADLPQGLQGFRPDVLARRSGESVLLEFRSRRVPLTESTVALAEAVALLPGWRLDLHYVPELPLTTSREELLQRAVRARDLGTRDPEAGLLLAWSAVEGVLHLLADRLDLDAERPGALLVGLAGAGALTDDQHSSLQRGLTLRNAVAHGRQSRPPRAADAAQLASLAEELATRPRVVQGAEAILQAGAARMDEEAVQQQLARHPDDPTLAAAANQARTRRRLHEKQTEGVVPFDS